MGREGQRNRERVRAGRWDRTRRDREQDMHKERQQERGNEWERDADQDKEMEKEIKRGQWRRKK